MGASVPEERSQIPMPEPPPPPPGWVPPAQSQVQTYHQRSYHYPVAQRTYPLASQHYWNAVHDNAVHYPAYQLAQQSYWHQNYQYYQNYQPSYTAPYVAPVQNVRVQNTPVAPQPQLHDTPPVVQNNPRLPIIHYPRPASVDLNHRNGDLEMDWYMPQTPLTIFGLIGETLLCPIKITLYLLGEIFTRAP